MITKEATWCEVLMDYLLQDKREHQTVLRKLPLEKRKDVIGRKGELVVDGREGGRWIIRLTPAGAIRETSRSGILHKFWMTEATLQDLILGRLDPREAWDKGLIKISGERILYHSEEIFQALEKWIVDKVRPIGRRILEANE
jgi:hypothetical protein